MPEIPVPSLQAHEFVLLALVATHPDRPALAARLRAYAQTLEANFLSSSMTDTARARAMQELARWIAAAEGSA